MSQGVNPSVAKIFGVFFRFGLTGFGGPAMIAVTVIILGRTRSTAPSMMAA